MRLRPATFDDAGLLFDWRNDDATRSASIHSEPVTWDTHVTWLRAALQDPARRLLIAECDFPVGTVRIDFGDDTELSWTVSPEARGRGYGRQMVCAAMPDGRVIAHIKCDNLASQKIAQAAGFRMSHDGPVQTWERD